MRDFFHGWRRKTGCVTLVLACAVATAWCRSLMVQDQFQRVSGITIQEITSDSGALSWTTVDHFEDFLDSSMPESGWFRDQRRELITTDMRVCANGDSVGEVLTSPKERLVVLEFADGPFPTGRWPFRSLSRPRI